MKKILMFTGVIMLFCLSLAKADYYDLDAFQINQTKTYTTKEHQKSKGINFTIKYPNSWIPAEGERPHIVQKFSKVFEDGTSVICLILIKDLPSEVRIFSDADIAKEMFSKESVKLMMGEGYELIDHLQTKYDGQPGALSVFLVVQEQVGIKIFTYMMQHAFIYSKKMVAIQCSIGGALSKRDSIEEKYRDYELVFKQIGNSLVIEDKWSQPVVTEKPSATELVFGEYWWLSILISAFLTWGVGLLLPVLIRFVFVRRPLSKNITIILVVVFWVFNIALFTLLESKSKTHSALLLVAVASYYILRRGSKKDNKKSNITKDSIQTHKKTDKPQICPKCGEGYDESWGVCFRCSVPLVDSEEN
ncbi:MAG: hypothetical protein V1747_03235 [Candidatus Omnitrophota bacterium]